MNSRVQYLEGIRGLAALWVVAVHWAPDLKSYQPYLDLGQDIGLNVPLFFVLSGRVLTASAQHF